MIKKILDTTKLFYRLTKDNNKILIPFYICYFFNVLISMIIPIVVASITSSITETNYAYTFMFIVIFYVVSSLKPTLSSFNMHVYAKFFNANYITLYKKVIGSFYRIGEESIQTGKLFSTLTNDIVNIGEIADELLTIILNALKFVILFIYFLHLNIILAFLILSLNYVYFKISDTLSNKTEKEERLQRKENDVILSLINQTIRGIKDIKTLEMEDNINIKYDAIYKRWSKHYLKKREYYIRRLTITELILIFVKSVIHLFCLNSIINGSITLSTMVLIVSYYSSIFGASREITAAYNSLNIKSVSLGRINDLIVEEALHKSMLKIDECVGKFTLKNLEFSYSDEKLIKNLNVTIYPNRITAIIGENGSGKTTLLDLLLRLKIPDGGSIKLDGIDISLVEKDAYLRNISVLNQETFLFNLSIKENFNLVCKDKKRIKEICDLTGASRLIDTFPKGENTIINEYSNNISGGEKRLISLTRTLLKPAKIILFDEITSSLDYTISKDIVRILKKLRRNHTIIIVTHKKELIDIADDIIRLR